MPTIPINFLAGLAFGLVLGGAGLAWFLFFRGHEPRP